MASELHKIGNKRRLSPKPKLCTMKSTIKFVAAPASWGGFKFPKLEELHMKLFNENFEGAHDAFNDLNATARCLFELKKF